MSAEVSSTSNCMIAADISASISAEATAAASASGKAPHQEGAQSQGEAGDLGEHGCPEHHQQRRGGKDVGIAHVRHAPVDGAQQRAPACNDQPDARHRLRSRGDGAVSGTSSMLAVATYKPTQGPEPPESMNTRQHCHKSIRSLDQHRRHHALGSIKASEPCR